MHLIGVLQLAMLFRFIAIAMYWINRELDEMIKSDQSN